MRLLVADQAQLHGRPLIVTRSVALGHLKMRRRAPYPSEAKTSAVMDSAPAAWRLPLLHERGSGRYSPMRTDA